MTRISRAHITVFGCLAAFLTLAVLLGLAAPAASAAGPKGQSSRIPTDDRRVAPLEYRPGEVIVVWKDGVTEADRAEVKSSRGVVSTLESGQGKKKNRDLLKLGPGRSAKAAVTALKKDPRVEAVGLNRLRTIDYTPSSTDFPSQWGYQNTGQTIGGRAGTFDADTDMTAAWDTERGDSNPTTVAVIDTGIDPGHPNLSERLWSNPGETVNGIDDDGNGYVDDVNGYNWAGISSYAANFFDYLGKDSGTQFVAQGFRSQGVNGQCVLRGVEFAFYGKVGNPTATITYSLRTSLTGPDVVATNPIAASRVASSGWSLVYEPFTNPVSCGNGQDLFLVARTSGVDSGNYFKIIEHLKAAQSYYDAYREGSMWRFDGSTWTAGAEDDWYFKTSDYYYNRDNNGHGTHCCGIVGAADNGAGPVGVAPGNATRIMALKAGDSSGSFFSEDWMDAIDYASSFDADVISMSFGGNTFDQAEQDAVTRAYNSGCVLLAAAGNDSKATVNYPGGYDKVIGVGATTNTDARAYFSNYNSAVDISAPGQDILSTMPTYPVKANAWYSQNQDFLSGTSMATPMAAGLAALVRSQNPAFTPHQVQQRLEQNADDLGTAGRDDSFGWGRINARRTVCSGAADSWGYNNNGQLGNGTTTNTSVPVKVSSLSTAVQLSGGTYHSLALLADGTVRAWGDSQYGQLGDGSTTDRSTPVQVAGLTGAEAVSGGNYHSLALKSDGTVWAWGLNDRGQLGNGSVNNSDVPVQVGGGMTGIVQVAAGWYHNLALRGDGTVWAWGNNADGQLGDNTNTSTASPVQVKGPGGSGNLTGVIGIAAGGHHSLALLRDGTAYAWGDNFRGQLGDDSTTDRKAPVQVKGVGGSGNLTGVAGVAAGSMHSLAVMNDRTGRSWGYNGSGQLGDNSSSKESHTPVVVWDLTGILQLDGSNSSSYALKSGGTVWSWGSDSYGELGAGPGAGNHSFPIQVRDLAGTGYMTGVTWVTGGGLHGMCLPAGPGAPLTSSINPSSRVAGTGVFTLQVTGSNFDDSSVVRWNGSDRTTTYMTGTQLSASIPASDITAAGTAVITVYRPAPGGGTSNPQTLAINNPVPTTARVSPYSKTAGDGAFTLTVNGGGFNASSKVRWNGADRNTTLIGPSQLTAAIPASDVAAAGTVSVTVFNPAPGGGTSGAQTVTINNPPPVTSGLDPASKTAGDPGFTLTVSGSGFVQSSVVKWNNSSRATTYVSPTELRATIDAADVAAGGTATVTVSSPGPGGGTSDARTFTINNPAVTLTGMTPESALVGSADVEITVSGTNFIETSVVRWNGADLDTRYGSGTELVANIPASRLTVAGTAEVTVYNEPPGGGTSNARIFTIRNPRPVLDSIDPTNKPAGGIHFKLVVRGSDFLPDSVVRWDGKDRKTYNRTPAEMTADIEAADISRPGTASVTVYSPGPGGGSSGAKTFTIVYPVPAITGLEPAGTGAGSEEFELTVSGTGFFEESVIVWNKAELKSKYVSPTEMLALVPAIEVANPGTANVIVVNPSPGGGESAPHVFNVYYPTPELLEMKPRGVTAGGRTFKLAVAGKGFVEGCHIRWDGVDLETSFAGPDQLVAEVDESRIAFARTVNITVRNPAPTQADSNALVFDVNNPVPSVHDISPAQATVGDGGFTMTVNGSRFVTGSVVKFDGVARATTYDTSERLFVEVSYKDMKLARHFDVTVVNDAPGGGTTDPRVFTVNNKVPALDSMDPVEATVGGKGFQLVARGSDFVDGCVLKWNGEALGTDVSKDHKELSADIPDSALSVAGDINITARNPEPTTADSNALVFTLKNPVPTITRIDPEHRSLGQGPFTLTVDGTGFVAGSVVRWNGSDRPTTYVSPTRLDAAIPASDIEAAGTAEIKVFNPAPGGGDSNAKTFTVMPSTWYLAEGTTDWGFDCYITIANPNTDDLTAHVTYMLEGGGTKSLEVPLPASSQTTVNPRDTVGNRDFSTRVVSSDLTKPIAVDRTMSWTGAGAASPEAHSSVGVNAPAREWYMPEGSTNWGFECWLCIQNPNDTEATCTVTFMTQDSGAITKTKKVPANSRKTYDMKEEIGERDASIQVSSDVAVIPERSMYRNNRREGHNSIGATASEKDYYLAEGTTDYGFTSYVCIQNPDDEACEVEITYMTPAGPKPQPKFTMDANSRETIRVNDALPNSDFSTKITGTRPIIAERAMYWTSSTGEACHDSIGMDGAHMTFYLPDGQSSDGRQTYTCVQNPNGTDVEVTLTYLRSGGGTPVVKTEAIAGSSRRTFPMAEHSGINGRAAIMVQSREAGKPIMVERAMYWNARGAGTCTIGGCND